MPISEQNGFVSEVRKIVQQMGGKKPANSLDRSRTGISDYLNFNVLVTV